MTRDRAQIVLDWLAAHGPAHVYDLAMHMGLQPDTMRKSIDRLRHEGRIHAEVTGGPLAARPVD